MRIETCEEWRAFTDRAVYCPREGRVGRNEDATYTAWIVANQRQVRSGGCAVAEAAAMPTQRGFWQISGKSGGPRSRFSRELAVRRLKVFLPSARSSKVAK